MIALRLFVLNNINQLREAFDCLPRCVYRSEAVRSVNHRNPRTLTGIRISLCIAHINRGMQLMPLTQYFEIFRLVQVGISKTDMPIKKPCKSRCLQQTLNISALTIGQDQTQHPQLQTLKRFRDIGIKDSRLVLQPRVFLLQAEPSQRAAAFRRFVREQIRHDNIHRLSEQGADLFHRMLSFPTRLPRNAVAPGVRNRFSGVP